MDIKQLKTAVMFAVSSVVACTVRICQLLFMTEPDTGFFYSGYETAGTLLTLLYVTVFAVTAVISYTELRGLARHAPHGIGVSVFSAVSAVIIAVQAVIGIYYAESVTFSTVFSFAVSVCCAAFFVLEALAVVNVGKNARRWMAVFPALYWLIQILDRFSSYMKMSNISEHLFDIVALGFLTLFFLFYGKTTNGVDTVRSMRLLAPVGLCTSLLCLVCTLPRLVVLLFSDGQVLHETATVDPLLLIMSVLVVMLIPRRVYNNNNK